MCNFLLAELSRIVEDVYSDFVELLVSKYLLKLQVTSDFLVHSLVYFGCSFTLALYFMVSRS